MQYRYKDDLLWFVGLGCEVSTLAGEWGTELGRISRALLLMHGSVELTFIAVKLQGTQLVRYNSSRHPDAPLTGLI